MRIAVVIESGRLLGAFFKGGDVAAQLRERFAGEMERAGQENWIRSRTCLIQRVGQ